MITRPYTVKVKQPTRSSARKGVFELAQAFLYVKSENIPYKSISYTEFGVMDQMTNPECFKGLLR